MATIYDEIKNQFCEKLTEEHHRIDIKNDNISPEILKFGINVLIEQIKKLRKNNFIHDAHSNTICWNKTSHLSQEHNQSRLSQNS
jgi:hypothetical protein